MDDEKIVQNQTEKANQNQSYNQNNQQRQNFTKKNKNRFVENADNIETEVKAEVVAEKPETVDLKFNSTGADVAKVASYSEPKNEVKPVVETEVETELETKVETKVAKAKVSDEVVSEPISGEVVSVSKLSYIVKTKEGKGVLVIGKHDKKLHDKV